ncbi:Dr1-associated corepressor [Plecturocebus cupreus]
MPSKKKKYNARFPPVSTWQSPAGVGSAPGRQRPTSRWGGGRAAVFGGLDAPPPPCPPRVRVPRPFSPGMPLTPPACPSGTEATGSELCSPTCRRGSRRSCRRTKRLGRWRRQCLSSSVSCRGPAGSRGVGEGGSRSPSPARAFSLTPLSPGARALPRVAVEEGLPGDPVPKRQDHDHIPPVSDGAGAGSSRTEGGRAWIAREVGGGRDSSEAPDWWRRVWASRQREPPEQRRADPGVVMGPGLQSVIRGPLLSLAEGLGVWAPLEGQPLPTSSRKQCIELEQQFDFLKDLVASVPDMQGDGEDNHMDGEKGPRRGRKPGSGGRKNGGMGTKSKDKKLSGTDSEQEDESEDTDTDGEEETSQPPPQASHPPAHFQSPPTPFLPFASTLPLPPAPPGPSAPDAEDEEDYDS